MKPSTYSNTITYALTDCMHCMQRSFMYDWMITSFKPAPNQLRTS